MTDEFTFADADEATGEIEAHPATFFASSDEFFRRFLRYSYRRTIGLPGKGEFVWRGDWWRVEEASCRIEAMWRSWEAARLDPTGMSGWWLSVADPHVAQLMAPTGPFLDSQDKNRRGEPLPYKRPPHGMFPPDNQSDVDFPSEPDEREPDRLILTATSSCNSSSTPLPTRLMVE